MMLTKHYRIIMSKPKVSKKVIEQQKKVGLRRGRDLYNETGEPVYVYQSVTWPDTFFVSLFELNQPDKELVEMYE